MYDVVLLDADMTVWDFEASEKLALRDVVEGLGVEMTPEIAAHYHTDTDADQTECHQNAKCNQKCFG